MASSPLLFAAVLLAVAAPAAQAQLLGLIVINGTVRCSVGAVTSTTPAFPNAMVQLQCGGNVVSSATTNGDGVFTMLLNPLTSLVSSLLSSCNLVVTTPLATCNASLPAAGGILQSGLQLVGGLLGGITNLVPTGFNVVPGLV